MNFELTDNVPIGEEHEPPGTPVKKRQKTVEISDHVKTPTKIKGEKKHELMCLGSSMSIGVANVTKNPYTKYTVLYLLAGDPVCYKMTSFAGKIHLEGTKVYSVTGLPPSKSTGYWDHEITLRLQDLKNLKIVENKTPNFSLFNVMSILIVCLTTSHTH